MAVVPRAQLEIAHVDEQFESIRSDLNNLCRQLQVCVMNFTFEGKKVIENLYKLEKSIKKFQKKANYVRTVTTASGVTSTVLTITGLALAPVTAGVSLPLTAVGIGMAVGAAATTGGVEYKDYSKTKELFKEINNTIKDLEIPTQELNDCVKKIQKEIGSMSEINIGVKNWKIGKDGIKIIIDGGRIIQNSTNTALAALSVGATPVKVTKVAAQSATGGGQAIGGSIKVAEAASTVGGKTLQSVSPLLMGLSAGFGVAFAALDIGLLIYSWLKKHQVEVVIGKLIKLIKEETDKWNSYLNEIQKICLIGNSHLLWQRLQYFIYQSAIRERQEKEEFEEQIRQLQQEAKERELRMKKEAEERERRIIEDAKERERQMKDELNVVISQLNERATQIEEISIKADEREVRMKQEAEERERRLKEELNECKSLLCEKGKQIEEILKKVQEIADNQK